MTSIAQLHANRRNAQRSTGPKTAEGKAVAAQNARRHGLTAETVLLDDEDHDAYLALVEDYRAALRPIGPLENEVVDRICFLAWRRRRATRLEAGVFRHQTLDAVAARTRQQAAALEVTTGVDSVTDDHLKRLGTQITDPETHQTLVREAEAAEARRDEETLAAAFVRDATTGNVLAKASRYEVTTERSLYRAHQELERLQARRAGKLVPAAAAVDVTVTGLGADG